MADIPSGLIEDAFKWGLAGVGAWLFRDVHKRIEDAKVLASTDLDSHKKLVQRDLDAMNAEIGRRREIEAKLFDEVARAERKGTERFDALARDMHKMHTDIIDRIERAVVAVRSDNERRV